jgi:Mg2+ and Co2+ transporter CorA
MYEYLLPSHVLLPPQPTTTMAAMLARQADGPTTPHPFWTAATDASSEQLKELKKAWRIDPETLARTRETAEAYEGTQCVI